MEKRAILAVIAVILLIALAAFAAGADRSPIKITLQKAKSAVQANAAISADQKMPLMANKLALEAQYEKEELEKMYSEFSTAAQPKAVPAALKISLGARIKKLLYQRFSRARMPPGAEPAYPVGLSPADLVNPLFESVDMAKYQRFQSANRNIFSAMVWVSPDFPEGRSIIYSPGSMQRLAYFIALLETGQNFPFASMPAGSFERFPGGSPHFALFFNETVVLDLYLAHAAISLYVEVNRLVPWSITTYSNANLALLFDGRKFVNFVPERSRYTFSKNYRDDSGLAGIIDWNPLMDYEFMNENGFVKPTQQETIYALSNWMRENMAHMGVADEEQFSATYGYNESLPVDFMLSPPEGWRRLSVGCFGVSSLNWALLSTLNIPVGKNLTLGSHRGVVFPTAGLALGHGDDVYNLYNRRGVQEVPVERIFYNLDEFRAMISPVLEPYNGRTPTQLTQSTYLNGKKAFQNSYDAMAYSLLGTRAMDVLYGQATIDRHIRRDYWRPLYDNATIDAMYEAMDAEILRIGGGNYTEGKKRIWEGIILPPY